MGTTPKGLVYPDSDDHTRLWEHFEALADSADDAMSSAWTDGGFTPGTGWSVTIGRYRVFLGALVLVDCVFTRTGAAISAGSGGDITDQLLASALPVALRPTAARYMNAIVTGGTGGSAFVNTNGTINLSSLYTGSSVGTGDTVRTHGMYALG